MSHIKIKFRFGSRKCFYIRLNTKQGSLSNTKVWPTFGQKRPIRMFYIKIKFIFGFRKCFYIRLGTKQGHLPNTNCWPFSANNGRFIYARSKKRLFGFSEPNCTRLEWKNHHYLEISKNRSCCADPKYEPRGMALYALGHSLLQQTSIHIITCNAVKSP